MKLIGKYKSSIITQRNHAHMNFIIENYRNVMQLDELEVDEYYSLDIKKRKSQRSIQQNAYMWKLLHELEKVTREIAMDWYIKALVETGAVVDYVWGTEETENTLKKSFRAVQRVKPHTIGKSNGWLYRVIVGSSKYTIAEMTMLLETVIRYCCEHDINYEVMK